MLAINLSSVAMQWLVLQGTAEGTAWPMIAAIALVLAAIFVFAVIYRRRQRLRRPKIKFLPKEKAVIITAAAKRHCPACSNELMANQAKARCTRDPEHVVHAECKQFMKGTCPTCRGALE